MVRAEEKLFNVISALTDEYNNYPHKRLKKSEVQNLVHDLEVVDAEFHDLKMPPITDDIQLDNKVCLFTITNELKDKINEPNVEDVEKGLKEFHKK